MPRELLEGTKEFYRRWMDEAANLHDVAESASQQAGPQVWFEVEPFTALAYESLVAHIVVSKRPEERQRRYERIRQKLHAQGDLAPAEVERRMAQLPATVPPTDWQRVWDEMFMIDLYPENRDRFGVNMGEIARLVAEEAQSTGSWG